MRPVPSRCAIFTTSLSIDFAACVLTLPATAAAGQFYATAPDLAVSTPFSAIPALFLLFGP